MSPNPNGPIIRDLVRGLSDLDLLRAMRAMSSAQLEALRREEPGIVDCDCPIEMEDCGCAGPCDCPVGRRLKKCACILAAEKLPQVLPAWAHQFILERLHADDYREPEAPPVMSWVLDPRDMADVMAERAEDGFGLRLAGLDAIGRGPVVQTAEEEDQLCRPVHRLRNGAPVAGRIFGLKRGA